MRLLPPRRRLSGAVACLRRDRHASGEHHRGGRSSGSDRSRNDPAADRRGIQSRRAGERSLRRRHGHRRQFGHDRRPPARLRSLRRQQCLRHGRHDGGLGRANGHHLERRQYRRDAAGQGHRSPAPPIPICRMSADAMPSSPIISTTSSRASRTTRISSTPDRGRLPPICSRASPACRCARSCTRPGSITCCCNGCETTSRWTTAPSWSAQADFVARLSSWDKESDPLWPLLARRAHGALSLNVPHFVTPSDGTEISDITGVSARTAAVPGLTRAIERATQARRPGNRLAGRGHPREYEFDFATAASSVAQRSRKPASLRYADRRREPVPRRSRQDRRRIAERAIRRGPGAAWIGLDWLGDADVFQLVCLGPDLYNGTAGIAVFLAAHAAVTGHAPSADLALAALSHLRKNLKSRNAARLARALGVGGATGLGSIVYAFAVIAK